jgi:NAD(P)-dependent dehydrogenase (short-subunit alcohol dehydrogenase family)
MPDMNGRVVLVTGAASGIGRATAARLADAGAEVAMVDRDGPRLEEAAAAIGTTASRQPLALVADVGDEASIAAAVASALSRFGPIDGVATCAGIFDPEDLADIEKVELATFDRVIGVNLRGTFLTLRATLPHLGSGSSAVTVASTAGLRGHGFGPAYTSSKGGVIALTRLAAVQYGPRGVRVNCICPGATAGEGMGAAFADPSMAEAVSADLPLRRVGQAGEIGATVTALLSAETSYLTGQVIAVDGGATVR